MSDEEPTARITLTTVYKELQEVSKTVTVLAEKLPAHIDTTEKRLSDHERRLRSLETRMWIALGGFALLTFASPYLIKVIFPN